MVRNKTIYWHNNQGEGGIAVVVAGAATAEGLDRPVDDRLRHVRRDHLDHRDLLPRHLVADRVHHVGRLQGQQARLLDHDARLGNALERHRLLGYLPAERKALFRAAAWLFEKMRSLRPIRRMQ